MSAPSKVYLGDGAYAEDVGMQVRLYCDRGGETHEVFLSPSEFRVLCDFLERAWGLKVKVDRKEGT